MRDDRLGSSRSPTTGSASSPASPSRCSSSFNAYTAGRRTRGPGSAWPCAKKIIEFHGGTIWLDTDRLSWDPYLVHTACHPRRATAMNVRSMRPPRSRCSLVEDDPGDVLMTREALAGQQTGPQPPCRRQRRTGRRFPDDRGGRTRAFPGPTSCCWTSICPGSTAGRSWLDQGRPVASPDSHCRSHHLGCRGRRTAQLRPPRQRLRHQAGRIRGIRRRRPPDRPFLPLCRPPPQALTPNQDEL